MSFNASGSSSKQQSTSTQNLDPQIKAALLGNVSRTQGLADQPYQAYSGSLVQGFSPDQLTAQNMNKGIASDNVGQSTLQGGIGATQGVAGYTPQQISSGPISDAQIQHYMDPYQSQVIDATGADLEHQRQVQQNYNSAQASKMGVWGGTGGAALQNGTNDSFNRTLASTIANLRSSGYGQALGAAQQDATRGLTADAANQSAGLAGAQLNLSAGNQLGQMSNEELQQAIARAGLVGGVGDAQQALGQKGLDANYAQFLDQRNWPIQMQQLLNQSLGLAGDPVLGQSQSTGKSSSASFGMTTPTPGG